MLRSGREFGNEFRYRAAPLQLAAGDACKAARLEGDYLRLDLVAGRRWPRRSRAAVATTAAELRDALSGTRRSPRPGRDRGSPSCRTPTCPAPAVWWDVAPAEVSALETTAGLRAEYEADLASQVSVRMQRRPAERGRPGRRRPVRSPTLGHLHRAPQSAARPADVLIAAAGVRLASCSRSRARRRRRGAGPRRGARPFLLSYGVPTVVRVESAGPHPDGPGSSRTAGPRAFMLAPT